MKVLFITGGSKGIGKELLKQFLDNDYLCYNFSRTSSKLIHSNLKEVVIDLSIYDSVFPTFKNELELLEHKNIKEILLINNAGLIQPIQPIGSLDELDVFKTIQVNYISPILLVNCFVSQYQDLNSLKKIINISSGAANYPIKSWSIYCSSKAALDMFAKTLLEEQKQKRFPFEIINFYPGKVDTDMQQQIRETSKIQFPDVDIFIDAKEKDNLLKPNDVAKKIYLSIKNTSDNELFRRI